MLSNAIDVYMEAETFKTLRSHFECILLDPS